MPYNASLKRSSTMKQTMNNFIAHLPLVTTSSKAVVIDAETLQSSKALVARGLDPANIVVINDEEHVIELAKDAGHSKSMVGISTDVLRKLHSRYDCIYLDFCGTPERSQTTGWDPEKDILMAADKLNDSGVLIVTFTTGHIRHGVRKALLIRPDTLTKAHQVQYSETSPMISIILAKTRSCQYLQTLERLYLEMEQQVQKVQPNSKRKRKRQHETERVRVTWKTDDRDDYKEWIGKEFYGTVLKKVKKGYNIKYDDGQIVDNIPCHWITRV